MESPPDEPGVAVARRITTLTAASRLFWRCWSPRVIATGTALAVTTRIAASPVVGWSGWDLAAVAVVATLIPFFEWFVHRTILHAPPRRLGRLCIDPGVGHREHHRHPASINWVLLVPAGSAVFLVVNAAVVAVTVGGPLLVLGVAPVGPVLTGIVVAALGLLHYEWSHFLFHTSYRPKSRRYRRLKANHRLHHWRNEQYWLGITSNLGDRAFGTYPGR